VNESLTRRASGTLIEDILDHIESFFDQVMHKAFSLLCVFATWLVAGPLSGPSGEIGDTRNIGRIFCLAGYSFHRKPLHVMQGRATARTAQFVPVFIQYQSGTGAAVTTGRDFCRISHVALS
jgi:hypothetical protein